MADKESQQLQLPELGLPITVRALRSLIHASRAAFSRRVALSSQDGSLLVEVLVGALVLSITTLAVLNGLDGAAATGADNRNRTQNATLAQQDIERLRALPITTLSNLSQTRTVTVSGVDYTVVSNADWVNDSGGVIGCTQNNPSAQYLQVTSKVHSPASVDKPVTEKTLLTPAPGAFSTNSGTATVRLTDREGNPLIGTTVALNGPSNYTDTTNDVGCAVFGLIPAGDYTAQVTGGVSWDSEIPASAVVTVNAGATSLTQIEIETPASLRAHFRTPTGARGSASWNALRASHSKLPGSFKDFPNPGSTTDRTSIDAVNLFPHTSAYGVYAGDCDANNPAFWNANYFQPGGFGYALLNPGDNLVDVDVVLPVVSFSVTKSNTRPVRVTATQRDNPVGEVNCQGELERVVFNITGTLVTVTLALPFGTYDFCLDDGVHRRTSTSTTVSTTSPERHNLIPTTGTPLTQTGDQVNLSTSTTNGTC